MAYTGQLYQLHSVTPLADGSYVAINGPWDTYGVVTSSTKKDERVWLNQIRGVPKRGWENPSTNSRRKLMAFRPEISTDGGDTYGKNSQVFATYEEAEVAAKDIFNRWFSATNWRVTQCTEEPTARLTQVGDQWQYESLPKVTNDAVETQA